MGWIALGGGPASLAPVLDLFLLGSLSAVATACFALAARRATTVRDRWGWGALSVATGLRLVVGGLTHGFPLPPFIETMVVPALVSARTIIECAALALFAGAAWQPADRARLTLDAATTVLGVAVVDWYFSLGPFVRTLRLTGAGLEQTVSTIGGSVLLLLASLLYLRRRDVATRVAAICLVLAYALPAAPVLFDGPDAVREYVAGSPMTLWWYGSWALRIAAARIVLLLPATGDDRAEQAPYRSGVMPYVLLAGTSISVILEVSRPSHSSNAWLVIGASALTTLLVLRQIVELREGARLRERLAADESRFSALVQYAYDVVVLLRDDGRASYVSPATHRILGAGVAFDAPWGILEAVHPEDASLLRAALATPDEGRDVVNARLRNADGEWRAFAFRLQDLRGDPRVRCTVLQGHDVTRESQLARRLREAAEVEALGVFAGGLAHDLNNVLGAIQGHVELLVEDFPPSGSAAAELRAILEATTRASTLTRNLVMLSRRKGAELEEVALRPVLETRPVVVDGDATLVVRVDRKAFGNALDAALAVSAAAPDGVAFVAPIIAVRARTLPGATAAALDLEPGEFVVCEWNAAATSAVSSATEDDDINVLLARAVLREMGGTLTVEHRRGVSRMSMLLPSGSVA